jgi:hypothetical protein
MMVLDKAWNSCTFKPRLGSTVGPIVFIRSIRVTFERMLISAEPFAERQKSSSFEKNLANNIFFGRSVVEPEQYQAV